MDIKEFWKRAAEAEDDKAKDIELMHKFILKCIEENGE